jgi:hypothetical protein
MWDSGNDPHFVLIFHDFQHNFQESEIHVPNFHVHSSNIRVTIERAGYGTTITAAIGAANVVVKWCA